MAEGKDSGRRGRRATDSGAVADGYQVGASIFLDRDGYYRLGTDESSEEG